MYESPESYELGALPRFYVTGRIGGASFGRACFTMGEARKICAARHAAGYRYLRIYEYATGQELRYRRPHTRSRKGRE